MNIILTNKLQSIITQLGLYDTGLLHNTIRVDLVTNQNILEVKIYSQSYIKYLLDDYPILSNFSESTEFKSEIELYIKKILESRLVNYLQNDSVNNLPFDLKMGIYYI